MFEKFLVMYQIPLYPPKSPDKLGYFVDTLRPKGTEILKRLRS
jgi:hypothetical protein